MMLRRAFLKTAGSIAATGATDAARAAASDNKVVYHLSDRERVLFVLGNIENHFKAFAPGEVTIALVVHGEPLGAFRKIAENERFTERLQGLVEKGLTPFACANTMEWLKIALADLPQGFEVADKGGVVKLAELQQKGFAYIRP
jgi:intracellular sulfur oxidation DsrE/DsrF family protein